MRKIWTVILTACVLMICGCSTDSAAENRTPVEFTVVKQEDIPEELKEIIEAHKENEIQMSYEGTDGMYIIRGYGVQPSGGYSISADVLELGEDGLYFVTTLIEPDEKEKMVQEKSYPYLVIKTEKRDTNIIFE